MVMMNTTYAPRKFDVNSKITPDGIPCFTQAARLARMVKKSRAELPLKPTFLKQWRKAKGKTQKDVATDLAALQRDDLPKTEASLSRIENGGQPVTQPLLDALEDIYHEPRGRLLDTNPLDAPDLWSTWTRATEDERTQIARLAETVVKFRSEPRSSN